MKPRRPRRVRCSAWLDHTALVNALKNNHGLIMVNVAAQGLALWDALKSHGIVTVQVREKNGVLMRVGETAAESPRKR